MTFSILSTISPSPKRMTEFDERLGWTMILVSIEPWGFREKSRSLRNAQPIS